MSSRIPILIIISLVLALQPYTRQAARVSSMGAVDHQTSWNGAKEIPSRKMFESFMENFAQMTRNQDAWRVGSQVRSPSSGISVMKRCAGLSTCILPILSERLYRNGVLRTHVGVNSPGKRRRALPALSLP